MEVAFIYIEEHRSISRLSIPLTSRHNFEYKNGQLKITNNNDLIEDFYSSVNLTAIIGKNGSGKSTILDFIEAIHSYNFSSGFIIFRKKENEIYKFEILYVNHEKVSIQSELNFKEITSLKQLNYNTIKINNLSSFGNSKPIKTKNILDFTSEKLGRTKTGRIKQINYIFEYFEYLKTTRKNKKIRTPSYIFRFNGWTNPLKNNLKKHFTNHLFSNDDSLSEILHKSEELVIDEYSHLNRESQKIEFRNLKNIKTIDELPPFIRKKLDYISEDQIQIFEQIFGENLFYNIFIKFIIKSTLKVLESLNIEETDRSNIIVIFLKRIAEDRYIENINFSPEPLMDDFVNSFILAKELRESYSISSSYISSITPEIQKEAEENYSIEIEKITAFLKKAATNEWIEIKDNNSIKNDSLPTIAFPNLDLQYKDIFTFKNNSRFHFEYKGYEKITLKEPNKIVEFAETVKSLPSYISDSIISSWEGMSSGEFAKVSLFSTILASLKSTERHKFKLVLIDEVDLYLHPEWQRIFISELIDIVKNVRLSDYVQFVITTHSPLIVSDFLSEDIVCLTKDDYNGKNFGFGTKIADFYLEGMHVSSTFGEHSRKKLQHLIAKKSNGYELNEYEKKLSNKICNDSIRETLLND